MELLRLRTNGVRQLGEGLPLTVYTVGTELQQPITRLEGFSANQLFIVFSGTGQFRRLGQHKWDMLNPGSLLYIPAQMPHEYMPNAGEPWFVGYVTYVEKEPGLMNGWGFGSEPTIRELQDTAPLLPLLRRIWAASGPEPDAWMAAELMFAFCLELQKQLYAADAYKLDKPGEPGLDVGERNYAVTNAVRFMHDHLERRITVAELASYVGYSSKQLTRLFRQTLNETPLRYLQNLRLRTGALLLREHPKLTVRQAAAYVGMEPVYFARLYRRAYGATPSAGRWR